jgi:catechol 2,3-dioxygenase
MSKEASMIQARKLGHIVLRVRDAQRSKDFYMRTLGLKLAHEDLTRGAVFLSFGEQHHELALFEELQAAYRELKAMGVQVESTVEHNVTRSVYFPDPDGNRVELYCDMVANGFESMRTLGPRRDLLDIETGEVVTAGRERTPSQGERRG